MAGQTIQISVLADTKKFSSAMKRLSDESGLSRLGGTFKKFGQVAAVGLGAAAAAAGAFAAKGAAMASDLEQSIGGVDAIFKNNADQIHKWAKGAASDLGLSQNSYNELAAIIGTTLKNSGTPMDALAGKTNDLIGISADLAATFGGPVTDASNAMASALRGEFEPLRKYGVSLSQADIQARALADTGKKSAKDLTKQEKALATQALILSQSTDAQGAFARESNTLAGQQERLKAKFENITTTVGTYLLPVLTKVTAWLSDNLEPAFQTVTGWIQNNVVPAFARVGDVISTYVMPFLATLAATFTAQVLPVLQQFAGFLTGTVVPSLIAAGTWVKNNADWILPLVAGIGAMVLAYQAYVKVMAIWKAITAAAAAAQLALNAVMSANPIGLIVLAVVGLVTAITLLWKKNEGFRNAIKAIWSAVQDAFATSIEAIKGFMSSAWTVIKKVWGYTPLGLIVNNWGKILDFFGSIPGKVGGFFSTAINWLKSAGTKIIDGLKNGLSAAWTGITTYFTEMPGKLLGTLGDAGSWLLDTGKNIINGLKNGILSVAGNIGEWIVDKVPGPMKGAVRKALGIASPSKVFKGYGKNVVEGLKIGITSTAATAIDATKKLSDSIAATAEKGIKTEADRLIAARKKSNDKIRAANKNRAKGTKAQELLPTLSRADAEKQAKKNLAATTAATKKANSLLAAQGKLTKGLWTSGGAKGLDALLSGFTSSGKARKGTAAATATLADVAKGREIIATRLENANARLKEMQDQYDQLKTQVSSSIKGELDLSSAITAATEATQEAIQVNHGVNGQWTEMRPVAAVPAKATFESVAGAVKTMAAKAKTFAGKLQALISKGIPPGLVQEVAALGTTEGITVADALLSGTAGQVQELAADYSELGKWSDAAGTYVADQMFGAGIAAQEGFIKGLEADSAKLEAAATTLATKVTKAVKKALGIKSPSRVFAAIGGHTIGGLKVGLEAGYGSVEKSLTGFTNSLSATTVTPPAVAGAAGAAGTAAPLAVTAVVDRESMRVAMSGLSLTLHIEGRPVTAIVRNELSEISRGLAGGYV